MIYGPKETNDRVRCIECKERTDERLTKRLCEGKEHPEGELFNVEVNGKNDYLCYVCRHFGQWRCRKEREVVAYLSEHLPDHEPSLLNKAIHGNLSLRYRPDIYYDLGDRALIVEVDEHQHESYPESCEAKRMLEITMTVGVPVIFLRYNPDRYQDPDGITRRIGKPRRLKDLEERVLQWANRPRDEWPRFFQAEYLRYSDARENPCREALDACLSDVFHLHPELS